MKKNRGDVRLSQSATQAERKEVAVLVLPGNPVSDGFGNVYRAGQTLMLPALLVRHQIDIGRVRLLCPET